MGIKERINSFKDFLFLDKSYKDVTSFSTVHKKLKPKKYRSKREAFARCYMQALGQVGIFPVLVLTLFSSYITYKYKLQLFGTLGLWIYLIFLAVWVFFSEKKSIKHYISAVPSVKVSGNDVTETIPLHEVRKTDEIVFSVGDVIPCNLYLNRGNVICDTYRANGKSEYLELTYNSEEVKNILLEGFKIVSISDDATFSIISEEHLNYNKRKECKFKSVLVDRTKMSLGVTFVLFTVLMLVANSIYGLSLYRHLDAWLTLLVATYPFALIPALLLFLKKFKGRTKVQGLIKTLFGGAVDTVIFDIRKYLVAEKYEKDVKFISADLREHNENFLNNREGQKFISYFDEIKALNFKYFSEVVDSFGFTVSKRKDERLFVTTELMDFDYVSTQNGYLKEAKTFSLEETYNNLVKDGYMPLICYYEKAGNEKVFDGIMAIRINVCSNIISLFKALNRQGIDKIIIGTEEKELFLTSIVNQIDKYSKTSLFESKCFESIKERESFIKSLQDEGRAVALISDASTRSSAVTVLSTITSEETIKIDGIEDVESVFRDAKTTILRAKRIAKAVSVGTIGKYLSVVLSVLSGVYMPMPIIGYLCADLILFLSLLIINDTRRTIHRDGAVLITDNDVVKTVFNGVLIGVITYFAFIFAVRWFTLDEIVVVYATVLLMLTVTEVVNTIMIWYIKDKKFLASIYVSIGSLIGLLLMGNAYIRDWKSIVMSILIILVIMGCNWIYVNMFEQGGKK